MPEFVQALENCQVFSCKSDFTRLEKKGRVLQSLKIDSKRKRTQEEIDEDKELQGLLRHDREKLVKVLKRMKEESPKNREELKDEVETALKTTSKKRKEPQSLEQSF